MGQINTRVVRRSAGLHAAWGEAYGPGFRYQEYLKFDAPLAQAKARAVAAGMNVFDAAMERPATRSVLGALMPKPGAGPSEAMMAAGWFTTELIGHTADGRSARARIAFRGDPGNRATLRILCEAGLCLAQDWGRLPGGSDCGGVLTPATALGVALVPRLRAAGFEIEVGRSPLPVGRRRQDESRQYAGLRLQRKRLGGERACRGRDATPPKRSQPAESARHQQHRARLRNRDDVVAEIRQRSEVGVQNARQQ